jgi:SAM-dependent methyltransferase
LRQDEPVPTHNAAAWDRCVADYESGAEPPTTALYGPDIATEEELRLLGDLRGKRVLELGCGAAQCSIGFVKQGATAIGVDQSAEQLTLARRLCEREEVRVELRQGDLADLAFVSADSIDLVFSAYAFGHVEDLNRVFRQVHRVLKVGAPLVFSLPHPAYDMIDDDSDEPLLIRRSYFDTTPVDYAIGGSSFTDHHHTMAEIYMGLVRASYRVDLIMEPPPRPRGPRSPHWRDAFTVVPRTLITRARKEGN